MGLCFVTSFNNGTQNGGHHAKSQSIREQTPVSLTLTLETDDKNILKYPDNIML